MMIRGDVRDAITNDERTKTLEQAIMKLISNGI